MIHNPTESLGQLIQPGQGVDIRLVRISSALTANQYQVTELTFRDGQLTPRTDATWTAINIAEPADQDGTLPAGIDTLAIDRQSQWIICVRPSSITGGSFPARIICADGGASYTVREQLLTPAGAFTDRPGATDLSANNLAELDLGSGGAVDLDSIVRVHLSIDTDSPPTIRYHFDHPCYAKYID